MSLTEYKKALSIYVLDGFVTEHVQISKQISGLYKTLAKLEEDNKRKCLMIAKRRELIQPLVDGISPKAYVGLWRELMVEFGEILYSLFELKYTDVFGNDTEENVKKKSVQKKIQKR